MRPSRSVRASALAVALLVGASDAWAQERRPLQEGDHPSVAGVLGGSVLGGAVAGVGVGGLALLAAGGDTDCYGGGCLALVAAGVAWPIGTALGARWAVRRQGFDVGLGRMLLYSAVATAVGVGGLLLVEQFEDGGGCTQPPAGFTAPECGTGPSDWTYALVSVGADLATLTLLTHFGVSYSGEGSSVALAPGVAGGGFGVVASIRTR